MPKGSDSTDVATDNRVGMNCERDVGKILAFIADSSPEGLLKIKTCITNAENDYSAKFTWYNKAVLNFTSTSGGKFQILLNGIISSKQNYLKYQELKIFLATGAINNTSAIFYLFKRLFDEMGMSYESDSAIQFSTCFFLSE